MDPDQIGPVVRTDLGPNCLQRISAEDQQTKSYKYFLKTDRNVEAIVMTWKFIKHVLIFLEIICTED